MAGYVVLIIFLILVAGALYLVHLARRRWRAFRVALEAAQRARVQELLENIEELPWETRLSLRLPLVSSSPPSPPVSVKSSSVVTVPSLSLPTATAADLAPLPAPKVVTHPAPAQPLSRQELAAASPSPEPLQQIMAASSLPVERLAAGAASVRPTSPLILKWVMPGESIEIDGHVITCGMFYAVRRLDQESWWLAEPTTLHAGERTILRSEVGTKQLTRLEISPPFQALYLGWLKDGRRSPSIGAFAACSFVYGIAVRLLRDRAITEKAALVGELLRLQDLIPVEAHSLVHLSIERLLPLIELAFLQGDTTQLRPGEEKREQLTLTSQVAIGLLLKQGRPIPFAWMFAWYLESPNTYLRIPAQRVPEEFRQLLEARFTRKYPNGMPVKPPLARFRLEYVPADRAQHIELSQYGKLPDITNYNYAEPLEQMRNLVEEATDALDGYSRFIGRYPDRQDSLAAVHLLPFDLALIGRQRAIARARDWLKERVRVDGTLDADELALFLLGEKKLRYTVKDLRRIAELLALVGYGVEPDPAFSDGVLGSGERAWVFQVTDGMTQSGPSSNYRCAAVLADTLVSVAMADGSIAQEERAAAEQIGPLLRLSEPERIRLRVHIERLCARSVTFTTLRKKLAALPMEMRHVVGRFAVTVATADGILEKAEVRLLERLYDELGIGRNVLFSDLHEASTQGAKPAEEPIVVAQAESTGSRFGIPKPTDLAQSATALSYGLDSARLQRILAETQQVSAVLGRIFQDAEEPAIAIHTSPAAPVDEAPSAFPGLDAQHAALLQELAARAEWTRDEYFRLTQTYKLMPDGALEIINEWAFDKYDEALIEDGDSVSINRSLLKAA